MTNCHLMETQNLVISFDYSWFLAKNLAYAECLIMKFHYRNSSSSCSLLHFKVERISERYSNEPAMTTTTKIMGIWGCPHSFDSLNNLGNTPSCSGRIYIIKTESNKKRAENWMLCFDKSKESAVFSIILQQFQVIFLTPTFISFTKLKIRWSFWGAEQV